jgi:catechol 2,3-dioxygenase-like lactoylglutathione lyase family enzyme
VSEHEVKMVILSTDDLDESIRFYSDALGMPLKFRDGAHFAALDGGPVTLALATAVDHPIPGQVVVGIKTDDVDGAAKAIEASGGGIAKGPPFRLARPSGMAGPGGSLARLVRRLDRTRGGVADRSRIVHPRRRIHCLGRNGGRVFLDASAALVVADRRSAGGQRWNFGDSLLLRFLRAGLHGRGQATQSMLGAASRGADSLAPAAVRRHDFQEGGASGLAFTEQLARHRIGWRRLGAALRVRDDRVHQRARHG